MPKRAPTTARGGASRQHSPASSDAALAAAILPDGPDTVDKATMELRRACRNGRCALLSCEPTLEGVLGAVGIAYLARVDEEHVRLVSSAYAQPRLDENVVGPFALDDRLLALAGRVWRGLFKKVATGCPRAKEGRCPRTCEGSCVSKIAYACAADDPSVPESVHRYVRLAFKAGPGIANMMAHPAVVKLDSLARLVLNECERTRQFTRFSLLADGSYLASFRPKADTVPLVASYFAKRMGPERFCLVDPTHCVAALHEAGAARCRIVRLDQMLADELAARDDFSSDEQYVRAMWKRLYDGLTIEGRSKEERGYDLRASWMPKRFWSGLFELDPRTENPGAYVPERYQGARKDALTDGKAAG